MITGVGWILGGGYAASLCFLVGALLIISGLIKRPRGVDATDSALLDSTTNKPFTKRGNLTKWRKRGFVLSTALLLALVGYGGFQYFKEPSDIGIRQIEIGWQDSGERLVVQPTNFAEPNKWVANIHYTSTETQDIVVAYTSIVPSSIADVNARNDIEDLEWDRVMSVLAHDAGRTKMKAIANTPTFTTLNGLILNQQQLEDMMNKTTAVYFMAVFATRSELWKRSWKPHAEVCVYRDGIAPVVHLCHDHNRP